MIEQFKQIYEIDRIVVQQRFEQVQEFIAMSRNFSQKVHGHLKIFTHLVNNLIESEDHLELVDTPLKMQDIGKTVRPSQPDNSTRLDDSRSSYNESRHMENMLAQFMRENNNY